MKSFKDYVTMNEAATITLPKAKNDQEIYDRLKLLKDAGIEAQSGGRSAHTDINVSSKDVAKAKKLLGLNEAQNYTVKVEVRDAREANELARNSYRGLYKNDGSDVFIFKKESDKEDFENDLLDMELSVLKEAATKINTRTWNIHEVGVGDMRRQLLQGSNRIFAERIKSIVKQEATNSGWKITCLMDNGEEEVFAVQVKELDVSPI